MTTTILDVSPELREWVEQGLIRPDQAEAIARYRESQQSLATPESSRDRRVPLFGEALGYLGAALVAVAAGILLAEYWDRMLYGVRLGLAGVLTIALVGVGALLRDARAPAAQRLAGFAWAVSVGGAAWFAGLVAGRDGLALEEAAFARTVGLTALAVAVTLWRVRPRWQQHVVAFVAAEATVVSFLAPGPGEPEPLFLGLAIAGLGVAWLVLAEMGVFVPAAIGRWVGLLGLLLGMRVAPSDEYVGAGLVLGLVVTAALLAGGVVAERPLYLGFGAASVFLFVPHAVFYFFGHTIGAPAALLLIGLLLLGVAVLVVRTRSNEGGN